MISTGTSNLSEVIQSIIDTSSSSEHDYQTNNRTTGKKKLKGYGPGHTVVEKSPFIQVHRVTDPFVKSMFH